LSALNYADGNSNTGEIHVFGADDRNRKHFYELGNVIPNSLRVAEDEGAPAGRDSMSSIFGWRIGIYADIPIPNDSTLNILEAKLGTAVTIDADKVIITLTSDQRNVLTGSDVSSDDFLEFITLLAKAHMPGRLSLARTTTSTSADG
jgi:hypothetical protein